MKTKLCASYEGRLRQIVAHVKPLKIEGDCEAIHRHCDNSIVLSYDPASVNGVVRIVVLAAKRALISTGLTASHVRAAKIGGKEMKWIDPRINACAHTHPVPTSSYTFDASIRKSLKSFFSHSFSPSVSSFSHSFLLSRFPIHNAPFFPLRRGCCRDACLWPALRQSWTTDYACC